MVGDAVRIGLPMELREYAERFDCSSCVKANYGFKLKIYLSSMHPEA